MDLNRLRTGEQVAAVAAIVLIVVMFIFKWFGLEAETGTALGTVGGSENAWGSFDVIDIVLLITVIAALGMAYLQATSTEMNLPVAASVVVAVLGALSTLLILYRLINPPDFGVDVPGVDETRKIGAYIGLIAAAVLTYGGWRAMQDEGTSFQAAADRLGGDRDIGGGPGPSAPGGGEPPSAPPPPPPPSSGAPPSA